jgi:peptide/nickel transport system ATP-binding protein
MTRLNPLMRIEDHFSETLKQHEPKLSKGEVRERSLDTLGRMGIPPTAFASTRTSSRAACGSAS